MKRLILAAIACLALPASAQGAFLATWGTNQHAQLATGYKNTGGSTVPVPATFDGVRQVCTGGQWGAALLENGQVETWGGNESGQAGNGTRGAYKAKPSPIPSIAGAVEVACNGEHGAARLASGEVRVWGSDAEGQNCDGREGKDPKTKKPYANLTPIPVPGVVAKGLAVGGADTLILQQDGSIVGCGENHKGQLGDGTTINKPRPTLMLGVLGAVQVAEGGSRTVGEHTLIRFADGSVSALGLNDFGQLGDGTTINRSAPVPVLSNATDISAGPDHNLAVLADGTAVAWGDDEYGALGAPAPDKCGGRAAKPCALKPQPVPGLKGVNAIAAGTHFSLVAQSGRPFAFGQNRWLTLGDGSKETRPKPVSVAGGLEGVSDLAAGYFNGMAVTTTHVVPELSVASGKGSLTVNWVSSEMHEPWHVAIRPLTKPVQPFGTAVKLAPGARSYTFGALPKGEYEVRVSSKPFGVKVASGVAS